jgi:hypothetical protein
MGHHKELHIKEIRDSYSSLNIVRAIKRMMWILHVGSRSMGETRNEYRTSADNLMKRDYSGCPFTDWRMSRVK